MVYINMKIIVTWERKYRKLTVNFSIIINSLDRHMAMTLDNPEWENID